MRQTVRVGGRAIAALAAVVAVLLGAGVFPADTALLISDVIHPIVAIGAGTLLAIGARSRVGRSQVAWLLVATGVLLFGAGDVSWAWYELVLVVEPPFPGMPDVFYLAAYPVLAAAMLVMPRLAANRFQRGQQLLDGVVVIAGVSFMAWITVLRPMYEAAGESTLAELLVGAAYPVGDALLIATLGLVGLRRSFHARDRSLWCVIAALGVTALGDVIYLIQSWSGSYVSGTWLDSTWLIAYGLFALAASWLPDQLEARDTREKRLPLWHILIPVGVTVAIMLLHFGARVSEGDTAHFTTEMTLAALGLLVLGRILFTVAEDRHLVDEERKRLISVVSHELRTPLTAVEGYIGLALANWGSAQEDENREMIEVAQDQARVVTRIVTDLVATSRDNLHATDLDLESIDVPPVVEEVAAQLSLGSRFELVGAPNAVVFADRTRLTQIVTNLLSNADRYGGDGEIVCSLRDTGELVEIAVHDAGPGVPAKFRDTIWEPFERGVHRFDAATAGSGLGLAVTRSLAQAHRGSVGYRASDLLGGACFWVGLPKVGATTPVTPTALSPVENVAH